MDLSLYFFPSAMLLGALHALEPGHAKTLTAAYLIGTKGTARDAVVLGLAVAFTHSLVVVALSVAAVLIGGESFTVEAERYLALSSSCAVIGLGLWLSWRRMKLLRRASQAAAGKLIAVDSSSRPRLIQRMAGPGQQHASHDHAFLSDEEHAKAHLANLPEYATRGERPSVGQIISFGAVGGLVPCPAAVSVMLLALSLSQSGKGLLLVLGFSSGLAITLVGIGLLVVTGISTLAQGGKFTRLSMYAPLASSLMVLVSGLLGLVLALAHH